LLTTGGLTQYWLDMRDREHVLRLFEHGQAKSRLPLGSPSEWPARYLLMYLDDGDPDYLDTLLTSWEQTEPDPDWGGSVREKELITWLRQRLTQRIATT
jgi:hypothetical protein